jgi:hypothetical protein
MFVLEKRLHYGNEFMLVGVGNEEIGDRTGLKWDSRQQRFTFSFYLSLKNANKA